jgi:hypothetical protein
MALNALYNLGRNFLVPGTHKPDTATQAAPLEHRFCWTALARARGGGDLHEPSCVLESARTGCGCVDRTGRAAASTSISHGNGVASTRSAMVERARTSVRHRGSIRRSSAVEGEPDGACCARSGRLFRNQRGTGFARAAQEKDLAARPYRLNSTAMVVSTLTGSPLTR